MGTLLATETHMRMVAEVMLTEIIQGIRPTMVGRHQQQLHIMGSQPIKLR